MNEHAEYSLIGQRLLSSKVIA